MKKVVILMLSAALVASSLCPAAAVEFKTKGSWQFAFDYINGGSFMGKTRSGARTVGQQWAAVRQQRDEFEAIQRLHIQVEAVASESLSGTVFFEIGEQRWGMAEQGGALGADGNMVKIKRAYLDWQVPNSALKLRMGLIGMQLPGFALDSPVFQDDVAGMVASYKFTDNVALTGFWMRPYNDNWSGSASNAPRGYSPANFMDNFDLVGLTLPLSYSGVKVTPWIMGGAMGPNTVRNDKEVGAGNTISIANHNPLQGVDGRQIQDGLLPAAFSSGRSVSSLFNSEYSSLFWGGITTDITTLSPWRFVGDFIYGSVDYGRPYLKREGWFGMLLAEYALDWGTPGLYGWYFSGDDSNPHNGSERLPYLTTTNNLHNSLSTFGYRGSPVIGGGKGVLGTNPTGTWGVGGRLTKVRFVDDLSHVLRVNVFGGSNDPKMASYITGRRTTDSSGRSVYRNNTDFNSFGTYLTTADMGMEVNFDSTYKPYDNLSLIFETGYIHLWLDEGTWGKYGNLPGNSLNYKDTWKVSLSVIYSF